MRRSITQLQILAGGLAMSLGLAAAAQAWTRYPAGPPGTPSVITATEGVDVANARCRTVDRAHRPVPFAEGDIRNVSSASMVYVFVEVTFYNSAGARLSDVAATSLVNLAPGETWHFEAVVAATDMCRMRVDAYYR